MKQYQHNLSVKQNLIIADLDSKEKSLIAKLNQNPKIWNNESLHFIMETPKAPDSVAVNLDVRILPVSLNASKQANDDRKFAQLIQDLELKELKTSKPCKKSTQIIFFKMKSE